MASNSQILDISCDDSSPTQEQLNHLYGYKTDISTKTYHRSRIALFQTLLRRLIAEGTLAKFDRALDIGCNAGFYCKILSDCGFRDVLGIDMDESYIAKANAVFSSDLLSRRITFETMDATAIPFSRRYDFVLCTEVIEHTRHPERVVASIMNLLGPGGIAIISLPNALSAGYLTASMAALLKGKGLSPELRDHMSYPFFKGPRLFKKHGARILKTSGVNSLFNDHLLLLLYRSGLSGPLNRANFWVSSRWPFKCFSQFYFFVIRKPESA